MSAGVLRNILFPYISGTLREGFDPKAVCEARESDSTPGRLIQPGVFLGERHES